MDELTAASAQSVRLVMAFPKRGGTLGYLEVSWPSLLSDLSKVLERTHLGPVGLLQQSQL